jgi:hypothetical protein
MGYRLLDFLRAPALVLSCPGPMRRHNAALIPLNKLALPQVFLGGESQCLAFAAAQPAFASRMVFAPAPEMFSDPLGLHAAWRALGEKPHATGELVHLRFGSVRDSRILKGARNAAVVAETEAAPPITTSHHPFASGRVLPAAMQRLFVYGKQSLRPAPLGGTKLPATELPDHCVTADLMEAATQKPVRGRAAGGLDLVRLTEYEAGAWASGAAMPGDAKGEARQMVLLPWNLAHFGSIVPEFLRRLAAFSDAGTPNFAILLMPFNEPGQTGMIGELRKTIKSTAAEPDAWLKTIFLARVTHLRGLAKLKKLSQTVWVDGNDPEAWWTLARFKSAGFDATELPADEPMRVEADTPFGSLLSDVAMPSARMLGALLAGPQRRRGARLPA